MLKLNVELKIAETGTISGMTLFLDGKPLMQGSGRRGMVQTGLADRLSSVEATDLRDALVAAVENAVSALEAHLR